MTPPSAVTWVWDPERAHDTDMRQGHLTGTCALLLQSPQMPPTAIETRVRAPWTLTTVTAPDQVRGRDGPDTLEVRAMAIASPQVINSNGHHLYAKVAGVTFGARQNILAMMSHPGSRQAWVVWLRREPDNPVDRNAVAVMVARQRGNGTATVHQVGYLPRKLAAELAGRPLPKVVSWRTTGRAIRGLRLKLRATAPIK